MDDTALKFIASKRLDGKEDYHFAPTAAQLEGLVKDMATETCTVCGVRCTVYCVLCAVRCVLCAVCGVRCAVCGVYYC